MHQLDPKPEADWEELEKIFKQVRVFLEVESRDWALDEAILNLKQFIAKHIARARKEERETILKIMEKPDFNYSNPKTGAITRKLKSNK